MTVVLRILLAVLAATASSSLADDVNRTVFALADKAIQNHASGQEDDAQKAFREFRDAWNTFLAEGSYNKTVYVKAAACFLAFGEPTNAVVLLKQVLQNTGAALPPQVPYLLVKSAFETGDNHLAIDTLEARAEYLRELSAAERQELAMIGAKAAMQVGDSERARKYLKETASIAPDTEIGKEAKEQLDRLDGDSRSAE